MQRPKPNETQAGPGAGPLDGRAESSAAPSVEIVTDLDRLESLAGEWQALAEMLENAFVSPQWFFAWIATCGDDDEPFVPVVRDASGAFLGLMPLVRSRGRMPSLRFAGARVGDLFQAVARPEHERLLIAAVSGELATRPRDWTILALRHVEVGSPWGAALAAARGRRLAVRRAEPDVLPFLRFPPGGWEEFLAAQSSHQRSQFAKKLRKLEREQASTFRMTSTPDELERDLETYFRLHDARRSPRGGTSFVDPSLREFVAGFAARALAAGWLRLWFLEIDGQAAATWLGWRLGLRCAAYSSGWDSAWARYSVGMLVRLHAMRSCAEEGCRTFDMLLGNEEYKQRFATGSRAVETLVATPTFHPARAIASAEVALRRAGGRLPPALKERARAAASTVLRHT